MAKLFFMDKDTFDLSLSPIPFIVIPFDLSLVDVIHTASNPSFDMLWWRDLFLKKEFNCSFEKELELKDKIVSLISVNDNRQSSKELVTTAYCKYFAYCKEHNLKNIWVVWLGCGIWWLSKEDTVECLIEAINYEFCRWYKCFNKDFKCRDIQFEENKSFHQEWKIKICESWFHFCKKVGDIFNYYNFDSENIICKVSGFWEFDFERDKVCFENIKVWNKISRYEILDLVNTGHYNTGHYNTWYCNTWYHNTGNRNTGNHNTGNRNTGHQNTWYRNTGNRNTGNRNTWHHNIGDCNTWCRNTWYHNTGHRNTWYWNTWDRNTGNRNIGNRNTGDFNNKDWEYTIFWKPSSVKKEDIIFPSFLYFNTTSFILESNMTEEEKQNNPWYKTIWWYLKKLDYKEEFQKAYNNASEKEKQQLKELPNFDADIFFEISWIRVE